MNPGKIVHPSKQDDRSLFRFKPGYQPLSLKPALDWRKAKPVQRVEAEGQ